MVSANGYGSIEAASGAYVASRSVLRILDSAADASTTCGWLSTTDDHVAAESVPGWRLGRSGTR